MPLILDIYIGSKSDFARNHLNISTYDEICKPASFGQQQ